VDVEVSGNFAYVYDTAGGLRVIDVSNPGPTGGAELAVQRLCRPDCRQCLYAFVAHTGGELKILDISNPGALVQAGSCPE